MESIGILYLHLVPRSHVTSLGYRRSGTLAAGGAETGLRWLVLWLHGNFFQDGDTLLLFSQVVHLAPCYCMPLPFGTCEQGFESVAR